MAVQVHPLSRNIISSAVCLDGFSWMDDKRLFVLLAKFDDRKSMLLCSSWSSYNLMMACTICQGSNDSAIWEYFPSGYVPAGNASIPYWATTDPTTWTSATFNIMDANATYQKNSSSITLGASPSSSDSSSSSKSTDMGAIVGGTIGGAAALLFLAIAAYLLYRRHVYREGVHAFAINRQGTTFMSSSGTHNRIPSDYIQLRSINVRPSCIVRAARISIAAA
ncbi:uncharacterized protein BJ212DRAFT_1300670 [Suillus subaureus]|uniref:Uncharacterized protein n=1 Tax=Suillus subaureus TaxID=48587 RepID=A0A9P7E8U2_9AGAM|nr:uncharacterized protein BJ212DRAFT_1300670 [Suillus subaureus]KAG1814373.1 hypothetical protein BJ212DRAFT_1300670 [Suillus subaureus]